MSRPDCQEDYSGVNGVDDGMICAGIDEGGEIITSIIMMMKSCHDMVNKSIGDGGVTVDFWIIKVHSSS